MTTTNGRPEGGWLKIFYRFKDWEWYADKNMVRLYLHLLLCANYRPLKWHGMEIPRGSLVTTRDTLANETGLTVQQVRTCLRKLTSTNEIRTRATNKYTVITICKYDIYQSQTTETDSADNQQLTSNQPANNQETTINQPSDNHQITTSKEYNNINNIKREEYVVVVEGATRDFFLESFFCDIAAAARLAGSLGIDEATMRRLATEVLDEWEITAEPPHATIRDARKHLLAQLRIKAAAEKPAAQKKQTKEKRAGGSINDEWAMFPTFPEP